MLSTIVMMSSYLKFQGKLDALGPNSRPRSVHKFCFWLINGELGPAQYGKLRPTRICVSLGLRMKFKTLFMSDHDLLIFFNMSNQFLAPSWGFEC